MSKCSECPVRAGVCFVEQTGLASLCTRPEWRRVALAQTARAAGQPLPSLATQAVTFGKAVARHVAGGLPSASLEERQRRRAICGACPNLTAAGRCQVCGCRVRHKVAWALEKCPIGRW